ncbi:hypothetical protein B0J11DRAFT_236367 [Dendryphion nanum]|uniref:C2H2-type domain-containing protein n=1 Tax=Dendryphion nanum TaxID=256645 RepID=A0A9P9CZ08_9PLEO|nr:hypothetical protein B0J11DRAFT_236367 [Dendryphion nanum]
MAHQFLQFHDLPQIPALSEDHHHLAQWHTNGFHQSQGYRYPAEKTIEDMVHNQGVSNLQPMQRFLLGSDPSPFVTGMHRTNFDRALPVQGMHHYDHPWPTSDCQYDGSRNGSPDRTSTDGTSSHVASNELRSPHPYHQIPYGSPTDVYHQTSYPSPGISHDGPFVSELPLRGGICPRDVEYDHIDAEQTVDDQDSLDTKPVFEYANDAHMQYYAHNQQVEVEQETYDTKEFVPTHFHKEESVHPAAPSGDESDSEYSPKSNGKRKSSSSSGSGRPKRSPRGRKNSRPQSPATTPPGSSNRVAKRSQRGSNASFVSTKSPTMATASPATIDSQRPFPCPLAGYGCSSTFASKNEWKRHMSTQHIKLGFWRCDLCTTTVDPNDEDTIYHNDFNRKDLFTQHLRRMHADPKLQAAGANSRNSGSGNRTSRVASPPSSSPLTSNHGRHNHSNPYPVTDENIPLHQKRCYKMLRQTPPKSACLFCDKKFSGASGWDERMEHVGRHMEKDRRPEMLDFKMWRQDPELQVWLQEEGLITWENPTGWKIGNGRPRRDSIFEGNAGEM